MFLWNLYIYVLECWSIVMIGALSYQIMRNQKIYILAMPPSQYHLIHAQYLLISVQRCNNITISTDSTTATRIIYISVYYTQSVATIHVAIFLDLIVSIQAMLYKTTLTSLFNGEPLGAIHNCQHFHKCTDRTLGEGLKQMYALDRK